MAHSLRRPLFYRSSRLIQNMVVFEKSSNKTIQPQEVCMIFCITSQINNKDISCHRITPCLNRRNLIQQSPGHSKFTDFPIFSFPVEQINRREGYKITQLMKTLQLTAATKKRDQRDRQIYGGDCFSHHIFRHVAGERRTRKPFSFCRIPFRQSLSINLCCFDDAAYLWLK